MTASMVLLSFVVHADDLPCVYPSMAQARPDLRAAVRDAPALEGLTYVYSVRNLTTAQQVLQSFAIEVQGSGSAVVEPLPPPTTGGYSATSRRADSIHGRASRIRLDFDQESAARSESV
jgi:hypothetical protein